MKENIVLSAWEMVTEFHSLKKLNFIPSMMGMLWLFVILSYQVTYTYVLVFHKKDEALETLSKFLHTTYFTESVTILVIIFLLYTILEPIATGGMIEMMHSYKTHHGTKNRRSWQGFFDGLRHFLPIFEVHNLTAIFRPLSVITFYIFLLRIIGTNYVTPISVIMGIYLVFAFCINICFAYAKFIIIFEHKGAIESLSASTGLAIRNIGITGKLYFTMILLYLRTIIIALIFLVIPLLISGFLGLLPVFLGGFKLLFLAIFLIISAVLFIFIVHLNSTLEIFIEATWYESYRLCKAEDTSHGHDEHASDHHGGHDDHHGDTHAHDPHHH